MRTPTQMAIACARFAQRVPMHANVVEGGKTPVQSAAELESQGFRIVIFPDGTTELMSVGKRYE